LVIALTILGYDFIAKLLIIGDSGVGKTCLLLRLCDNSFTTSHLATIGIDFKLKNLEVDGKKIKMQIWDTAGQDRFKTITQTYYRGAMGILLTYACNDRESFVNIENWMKQIKARASEDVSIVIVGNKSDMEDRCISYEEGKKLADTYGMHFFETSAKQDMNVNDAFKALAREIKEKIVAQDGQGNNQNNFGTTNTGVKLDPQQKGGKEKKACCS